MALLGSSSHAEHKVTFLPPSVIRSLTKYTSLEDNNCIGGFFNNQKCAWISSGPNLEVVSTGDGSSISTFTFGLAASTRTSVSCVIELPSDGINNKSKKVTTNHLIIGLKCENKGMICVFDIRKSKVLRAVNLPQPVTSLCLVDTGIGETSFTYNPHILNRMIGIVAVGLEHGEVFLLDLCRPACIEAINSNNGIRNERFPCDIRRLTMSDIENLMNNGELHIDTGSHWCTTLNENTLRNEKFLLMRPDGSVCHSVLSESIFVSCIMYARSLASVVVGFNFGAFQIWNLTNGIVDYTSSVLDPPHCVTHFAVQEPADDPLRYCYLWVVYHRDDTLPLFHMYSLYYRFADHYEGYGAVYQEFESAVLQLTFVPPSGDLITRCISCYSIEQVDKDDDVNHPPGYDSTICLFAWETVDKDENRVYLTLFDLNKWYTRNIPSDNNMGYYHTVEVSKSSNSVALDAIVNPSTFSYFKAMLRTEEHFHPSALSFASVCLFSDAVVESKFPSVQRDLLAQIQLGGPECLQQPSQLFLHCFELGLKPFHSEVVNQRTASVDEQRRFIMSLALEYQLFDFLTLCACEWASGTQSVFSCTMQTFLDWVWSCATTFKTHLDKLCIKLYDHNRMGLDTNWFEHFSYYTIMFNNLHDLFTKLLNNENHLGTLVDMKLLNRWKQVLERLVLYVRVVHWFTDVGLLPERPKGFKHDYEDTHNRTVPYPLSDIASFYQERRENLKTLCSAIPVLTDIVNPEDILFIDTLIRNKFKELSSFCKRDGGSGYYPPPSLQSLLSVYLSKDVTPSFAHCIAMYVFMDLNSVLYKRKYDVACERFITFRSAFDISPSLIKFTEAFWYLDHGEFKKGLSTLLEPVIIPDDLKPWIHHSVLSACLTQKQYEVGLKYIQVHKPILHTLNDIKLHLCLLLANGHVPQALECVRSHQSCETTQNLLYHFFACSYYYSKLETVMKYPLSPLEEEAFTTFLQECKNDELDDLRVMYYLQRGRVAEAIEINDTIAKSRATARSNSFKWDWKDKNKKSTRDMIVHNYACTLPQITQISHGSGMGLCRKWLPGSHFNALSENSHQKESKYTTGHKSSLFTDDTNKQTEKRIRQMDMHFICSQPSVVEFHSITPAIFPKDVTSTNMTQNDEHHINSAVTFNEEVTWSNDPVSLLNFPHVRRPGLVLPAQLRDMSVGTSPFLKQSILKVNKLDSSSKKLESMNSVSLAELEGEVVTRNIQQFKQIRFSFPGDSTPVAVSSSKRNISRATPVKKHVPCSTELDHNEGASDVSEESNELTSHNTSPMEVTQIHDMNTSHQPARLKYADDNIQPVEISESAIIHIPDKNIESHDRDTPGSFTVDEDSNDKFYTPDVSDSLIEPEDEIVPYSNKPLHITTIQNTETVYFEMETYTVSDIHTEFCEDDNFQHRTCVKPVLEITNSYTCSDVHDTAVKSTSCGKKAQSSTDTKTNTISDFSQDISVHSLSPDASEGDLNYLEEHCDRDIHFEMYSGTNSSRRESVASDIVDDKCTFVSSQLRAEFESNIVNTEKLENREQYGNLNLENLTCTNQKLCKNQKSNKDCLNEILEAYIPRNTQREIPADDSHSASVCLNDSDDVGYEFGKAEWEEETQNEEEDEGSQHPCQGKNVTYSESDSNDSAYGDNSKFIERKTHITCITLSSDSETDSNNTSKAIKHVTSSNNKDGDETHSSSKDNVKIREVDVIDLIDSDSNVVEEDLIQNEEMHELQNVLNEELDNAGDEYHTEFNFNDSHLLPRRNLIESNVESDMTGVENSHSKIICQLETSDDRVGDSGFNLGDYIISCNPSAPTTFSTEINKQHSQEKIPVDDKADSILRTTANNSVADINIEKHETNTLKSASENVQSSRDYIHDFIEESSIGGTVATELHLEGGSKVQPDKESHACEVSKAATEQIKKKVSHLAVHKGKGLNKENSVTLEIDNPSIDVSMEVQRAKIGDLFEETISDKVEYDIQACQGQIDIANSNTNIVSCNDVCEDVASKDPSENMNILTDNLEFTGSKQALTEDSKTGPDSKTAKNISDLKISALPTVTASSCKETSGVDLLTMERMSASHLEDGIIDTESNNMCIQGLEQSVLNTEGRFVKKIDFSKTKRILTEEIERDVDKRETDITQSNIYEENKEETASEKEHALVSKIAETIFENQVIDKAKTHSPENTLPVNEVMTIISEETVFTERDEASNMMSKKRKASSKFEDTLESHLEKKLKEDNTADKVIVEIPESLHSTHNEKLFSENYNNSITETTDGNYSILDLPVVSESDKATHLGVSMTCHQKKKSSWKLRKRSNSLPSNINVTAFNIVNLYGDKTSDMYCEELSSSKIDSVSKIVPIVNDNATTKKCVYHKFSDFNTRYGAQTAIFPLQEAVTEIHKVSDYSQATESTPAETLETDCLTDDATFKNSKEIESIVKNVNLQSASGSQLTKRDNDNSVLSMPKVSPVKDCRVSLIKLNRDKFELSTYGSESENIKNKKKTTRKARSVIDVNEIRTVKDFDHPILQKRVTRSKSIALLSKKGNDSTLHSVAAGIGSTDLSCFTTDTVEDNGKKRKDIEDNLTDIKKDEIEIGETQSKQKKRKIGEVVNNNLESEKPETAALTEENIISQYTMSRRLTRNQHALMSRIGPTSSSRLQRHKRVHKASEQLSSSKDGNFTVSSSEENLSSVNSSSPVSHCTRSSTRRRGMKKPEFDSSDFNFSLSSPVSSPLKNRMDLKPEAMQTFASPTSSYSLRKRERKYSSSSEVSSFAASIASAPAYLCSPQYATYETVTKDWTSPKTEVACLEGTPTKTIASKIDCQDNKSSKRRTGTTNFINSSLSTIPEHKEEQDTENFTTLQARDNSSQIKTEKKKQRSNVKLPTGKASSNAELSLASTSAETNNSLISAPDSSTLSKSSQSQTQDDASRVQSGDVETRKSKTKKQTSYLKVQSPYRTRKSFHLKLRSNKK